MSDKRAIQLMLRNPQDMMRFQASGTLPTPAAPRSPLIIPYRRGASLYGYSNTSQ